MILQGFVTNYYVRVNVDGPENPPNYPKDFLGDLVWSGVPIIDPRKSATSLFIVLTIK